VKHHRRQIEQLLTFLSRERAEMKPEATMTLSVISGTSVLAFTKVSGSVMTALAGLVRLFL
jgi:hypothetical protein